MLYRKIENRIKEKLLKGDKIVVVDGARQIGKTYTIREIGKKNFKYFNEINLVDDYNGQKYFEKIKNINDLYLQLSSIFGASFGDKKDTLIFLDEIQVYPHLITMLKFLKDDDRYSFICSGSELGLVLSETNSIPIGYIEKIRMHQLDFEEFLLANGVANNVIVNLKESFENQKSISEALHIKTMELFRKYLLIGGLPDAVNSFIKNNNIQYVRDIHNEIYNYYKIDASKYSESRRLKIRKIYDMIPSTLENKKKRVVIKNIEGIKGKCKANYIDELDYLINSGIVLEVNAISNPVFPLIETESKNLFKLYMNDVGILSNIYYKNNIRSILDDELSINLGTIYENVAAMELNAHDHKLFYYDNNSKGEVDYLIDDYDNGKIIPIEIKSGKDYKVHSAIDNLINDNKKYIEKAFVFNNTQEIINNGKIIYYPIYNIMFI